MAKVLIYKTAQGTISECTPAAKTDVQRDLSSHGRDKFIENHRQSITYDESVGDKYHAQVHANKITWAQNVVDFDNITDTEFEALIHTHTPPDVSYHFWIDNSLIVEDRTYRDAWVDIDSSGKVTVDLNKAKDIQLKLNAVAQAKIDAQSTMDAKIKADPLNAKTITSLDDIKAGAING